MGPSEAKERLFRERMRPYFPAGGAAAALLLLVVLGAVTVSDLGVAGRVLWRPVLVISSIMVTTACAQRLGVMDRITAALFVRSRGTAVRLLVFVFLLSAGTAAILNNDSAVLLLVPIVIPLVRSIYPGHPELLIPFALVVFGAAGVAPLIVSNPMNLIVAEYVGIGFNSYAARMVPIAVVCWLVSLGAFLLVFRSVLVSASKEHLPPAEVEPWTAPQLQSLGLLLAVLLAYPIVSYAGGPVWSVTAIGALLALFLCARHGRGSPAHIASSDVAWEILIFMVLVSTAAIGLRDAEVVTRLSAVYADTGVPGIGGISAAGAALINNHPMSLINMLAIDIGAGGEHIDRILAALIGGDLGPRLLPWGSLAGLLWYASLRRFDIHVPIRRFAFIGLVVTLPSLMVSLALLRILP